MWLLFGLWGVGSFISRKIFWMFGLYDEDEATVGWFLTWPFQSVSIIIRLFFRLLFSPFAWLKQKNEVRKYVAQLQREAEEQERRRLEVLSKLGLNSMPIDKALLNKARRQALAAAHPDRSGSHELFLKLSVEIETAYSILLRHLNEGTAA